MSIFLHSIFISLFAVLQIVKETAILPHGYREHEQLLLEITKPFKITKVIYIHFR